MYGFEDYDPCDYDMAYDDAVVPYATKYYANTIVAYSYSKSLSLSVMNT